MNRGEPMSNSEARKREQERTHLGGGANAEDCKACSGLKLKYPWICPGGERPSVEVYIEDHTTDLTIPSFERVSNIDLEDDGPVTPLYSAEYIEAAIKRCMRELPVWGPDERGLMMLDEVSTDDVTQALLHHLGIRDEYAEAAARPSRRGKR